MTMLDRMRRHKGWLKWSLALVVLAFIVFYIPSFLDDPTAIGTGAAPSEVIADVEGRSVTAGQFQQRYNAQIQTYRQAYGAGLSDSLLRQLGIEQQILQQMVDEQAALVEAERHGLGVSDEELAQQIFAIPGLQENGRFVGEQRYEQILRSQIPPLTKATFEETLRRSLMIDKLRAALTDWMTVSDADVEREFTQRNEKVKLQVVALTADSFRNQVTVSDADVSSHFEAHKAEYRVGEQRKVRMLLLDREQAYAQGDRHADRGAAVLQRQYLAVPDARAGSCQSHPAEHGWQGRSRRAQAGRGHPRSRQKRARTSPSWRRSSPRTRAAR